MEYLFVVDIEVDVEQVPEAEQTSEHQRIHGGALRIRDLGRPCVIRCRPRRNSIRLGPGQPVIVVQGAANWVGFRPRGGGGEKSGELRISIGKGEGARGERERGRECDSSALHLLSNRRRRVWVWVWVYNHITWWLGLGCWRPTLEAPSTRKRVLYNTRQGYSRYFPPVVEAEILDGRNNIYGVLSFPLYKNKSSEYYLFCSIKINHLMTDVSSTA